MRVIRLTLAYDGTGFRGWAMQRDPGVRTIEGAEELLASMDRFCAPDARLAPSNAHVRVRHVIRAGQHFYMLFNESGRAVTASLTVAAVGSRSWIDTVTGRAIEIAGDVELKLDGYQLALLGVA